MASNSSKPIETKLKAYARANTKTGILTQDEFKQIEKSLLAVKKEWEDGTFEVKQGDEDIVE
ncbi:MAG: hypothetical protein Q9214_003811 [Letrouitia sp. 1 TL-2023]